MIMYLPAFIPLASTLTQFYTAITYRPIRFTFGTFRCPFSTITWTKTPAYINLPYSRRSLQLASSPDATITRSLRMCANCSFLFIKWITLPPTQTNLLQKRQECHPRQLPHPLDLPLRAPFRMLCPGLSIAGTQPRRADLSRQPGEAIFTESTTIAHQVYLYPHPHPDQPLAGGLHHFNHRLSHHWPWMVIHQLQRHAY